MSSPVMRDHARASKADLLAGRHNTFRNVLDVDLNHVAMALATGIIVGYVLWHQPPVAPKPLSPYYQRFEFEVTR